MTVTTTEVVVPIVSINVDKSYLNFGSIVEGESGSDTVTITNTGDVNVDVSWNVVESGTFYLDNLGYVPSSPILALTPSGSSLITLTLIVPSDTPPGVKTATLVFWAEAST